MKIKFHKRVIALLLAAVICITSIPLTAFATPDFDLSQILGGFAQGDANNHWIEFTNGARLTAINSNGGSVATDANGNKIRSIDWVEDLVANDPSVESRNKLAGYHLNLAYSGKRKKFTKNQNSKAAAEGLP